MAEQWPAQLKELFNVAGFNKEKGNPKISSDMQAGPPKQRARVTKANDIYSVTMDMSQSEVNILENFYDTTLNNGTLAFEFDDPTTGQVEEFKFVASFSQVPLGNGGVSFRVSFQLRKEL